jgi:hypothetical protein
MTGIQFITEEKAHQTAAAIDLKKHKGTAGYRGCAGFPIATK